MRSLRLLWIALILVLVVPLYGQVSCNRSCPPAPNPCQVAAGRSIETGQCVYSDIDGATCDAGGVTGTCSGGQCIPGECTAQLSSYYGFCDEPLGGGSVGACIDDTCIDSQPQDWCVKVGVGRINCCSPEGCRVANGAYCNDPLSGVSCDTTGIEPPGLAGQDGTCVDGACVALSGACLGVPCRTTSQDPCVRKYCDSDIGQCADWPLSFQPTCVVAEAPGLCHAATCVPVNEDILCGGESCSISHPCKQANCRLLCLGPPNTCSPEELANPSFYGVCEIADFPDGAPCRGEPGECRGGTCLPLISDCRDFVPTEYAPTACNDYEECTDDSCCNSIDCIPGICENNPKDDGEACAQSSLTGEYLGACGNGVCLPDLCRERDCPEDADPCTEAECNSPWGSCTQRTLDDGEPCIGQEGECSGGSCVPIISDCRDWSDPDAGCDDNKECTDDFCCRTLDCIPGICQNPPEPNGTRCTTRFGDTGQCLFGSCQPLF